MKGKSKKPKALCLFSGGLDSVLAAEIVRRQGIKVIALHFVSPFFGNADACKKLCETLGIKLMIVELGSDYLEIIRRPKHGYGTALNPCVDCRIYMLKKAKEVMKKINARFIVTGEVLGQRPMSQNRRALTLIERSAGLTRKILRPLSAKLLPETEAEKSRLVKREHLFAISGRRRTEQLKLARKFGIREYLAPSGGCLLTQREFALKLKDLLEHKKRVDKTDLELLKIGRHFRSGRNRIIVGRNEAENELLLKMKRKSDYLFEVPNFGSPITLLQGPKTSESVMLAAKLTARYSDCRSRVVEVRYGRKKPLKKIYVPRATEEEIESVKIIK